METNINLARSIAVALGGSLEQEPYNNPNYFRLSVSGVELSMYIGGYQQRGRISFGTSYPRHQRGGNGALRYTCQRDFDRTLGYGDAPWDGITVADTKTPEQIAKDIQRRFLPTYVPLYGQAVQYCAEQANYWAVRNAAEGAIRKAVEGVVGLRLDYMASTTARLEIDADPALAVVIAQAIKNYRATLAP